VLLVALVVVLLAITPLLTFKSFTVVEEIVPVASANVPVATKLVVEALATCKLVPVALKNVKLSTLRKLAQRFWKLPQIPVVEATVVEANVEVPYELIV
jgi:hypothetical protein